jgi:aminocarboxymuconate-semialdehyde decarboxylase
VGGHLPTAGVDDLDRREEWMQECGIELQLLGPELSVAPPTLGSADATTLAQRMNETAAEDVRGRPAFAPLAMVPLQSGDQAAAELERTVRELGFRGAMIPSTTEGGLGDPRLDPLWASAVALDVPIVVHSGRPAPDARLEAFGLDAQVGRPHEVAIAAISLVFGGVLDRFPELRLVLVMGGGTLTGLVPRLDRVCAQRGDGIPAQPPSAYLRRFYYDALVLEPARLRALVDEVGDDRVMVGTDWPFPVFDDDPAASVRGAALEASHKILRENARSVFRV